MRFDAFISYRRVEPDATIARLVQEALERYRLPGDSKRRLKVFLDFTELAAGILPSALEEALRESAFLIVICSPRTLESAWVRAEIDTFIAAHGVPRVLPLLIEGTPASAFPPPLDSELSLGADVRAPSLRGARAKLRNESLRLIAPMAGMRFDELRQRDAERTIRRARWTLAASLGSLVLVSSLAGIALWQWREANLQRDKAERRLWQAQDVARRIHSDVLLGSSTGGLTTGERRNLVERAQQLVAYLERDSPDESTLAALKTSQLVALGDAALAQGDAPGAKSNFLQVVKLLDEYLPAHPGDQSLTAARSLVLIQLGVAEEATGNPTAADEYQQRGIEELRNLALRAGGDGGIYFQLAQAFYSRVQLLLGRGQYAAAFEVASERLVMLERLRGKHPDPVDLEYQIGVSHSMIATAMRFKGDAAASASAGETALELFRRLLRENPNRAVLVRTGIAGQLVELGHLHLDVKDFEGARARFAEAVASYRDPELVSRGDARTAFQYRMALIGLAEAANGAGQGEQALAAADELIAEVKSLSDLWWQRLLAAGLQHRATALALLGRLPEANIVGAEALTLRRSLRRPFGPMTELEAAITMIELARIKLQTGDRPAASELATEAVGILEQSRASLPGWERVEVHLAEARALR